MKKNTFSQHTQQTDNLADTANTKGSRKKNHFNSDIFHTFRLSI